MHACKQNHRAIARGEPPLRAWDLYYRFSAYAIRAPVSAARSRPPTPPACNGPRSYDRHRHSPPPPPTRRNPIPAHLTPLTGGGDEDDDDGAREAGDQEDREQHEPARDLLQAPERAHQEGLRALRPLRHRHRATHVLPLPPPLPLLRPPRGGGCASPVPQHVGQRPGRAHPESGVPHQHAPEAQARERHGHTASKSGGTEREDRGDSEGDLRVSAAAADLRGTPQAVRAGPRRVRLHGRDRRVREVPHGHAHPRRREEELPAEQPGPVRPDGARDAGRERGADVRARDEDGGRRWHGHVRRRRRRAVGLRGRAELRPPDLRRDRPHDLPQRPGRVRRQVAGGRDARRRRRRRRRGQQPGDGPLAAGVQLHRAALHAHPQHALPSHAALPGPRRRPVPAGDGAGGAGPAGGLRQLLLQHAHQRRERHARHGLRRQRRRAAAQRRLISDACPWFHLPVDPPGLSVKIKLIDGKLRSATVLVYEDNSRKEPCFS